MVSLGIKVAGKWNFKARTLPRPYKAQSELTMPSEGYFESENILSFAVTKGSVVAKLMDQTFLLLNALLAVHSPTEKCYPVRTRRVPVEHSTEIRRGVNGKFLRRFSVGSRFQINDLPLGPFDLSVARITRWTVESAGDVLSCTFGFGYRALGSLRGSPPLRQFACMVHVPTFPQTGAHRKVTRR